MKKEDWRKRKEETGTEQGPSRAGAAGPGAYLTLEAALVLPLVTGVIVLLIYLGFFQYNRCLLEQDVGAVALKGCSYGEEDKKALAARLEQAAKDLYLDKYIAWQLTDVGIELSGSRVSARGSGSMRFPFSFLLSEELGEGWGTSIKYENVRINPVDFIRTYRKITGGE